MKDIKIKPYVAKLIKENIIYIIGNILLLILIALVVKIGVDRITVEDRKINVLRKDISTLQARFNLLNSVAADSASLDTDIKLLNSLIPEVEDYFTIIYALDALSRKTGFVITSYSVNVKTSTAEKLKLTITGTGDSKTFMDFLASYNYSGGRLITSDKIELNPEVAGAIKINLTFYNKKVAQSQLEELTVEPKTIEEIAQLRQKVDFSFANKEAEEVDLSYPRKTNPF